MEIDEKKLKELDIKNNGKKKQFCPKCHGDRKHHPKEKELSVDWDRCIAYCHHCGESFFFGKTEKIGHQPTKKQTMRKEPKEYKKPAKLANETAPDEKVLAWFASRGIPAEAVIQEGITQAARRRQVLVVLAAHPTKMKRDPLTKQFPVPTMYVISGSAAFFNKADFGIAIERDRTKEVTRVHVQKVKFRHLGYPGVASFKYNTHNGRFVSIEEGKTPDIPDIIPDYDNGNWLAKKQPKQGELGL